MIAFELKTKMALLALVCVVAAAASFAPVMAQAPAAEKKTQNARLVAAKKTESDQDKLQGKWQLKSIAFEDKVFTSSQKLDAWKETFDNELVIAGDRLSHTTNRSTFKLDETANPKQITFQDASGKLTFRGIYDIQADVLKVCINGDGRSETRPEEFATKKGAPVILLELGKSPTK